MQSTDKGAGTGGVTEVAVCASHRILIEPGQEPYSRAQRRLEVKRALHCVGGDLLNLSEAARLSSQQINNFVADARRLPPDGQAR